VDLFHIAGFFKGQGGEQRNPRVKRRIAQEENSLYGHKLLKKSQKFRQTNWLQLCLFVTVANLKKFVELHIHNYYPVWLAATHTSFFENWSLWKTYYCKQPYYCWYNYRNTAHVCKQNDLVVDVSLYFSTLPFISIHYLDCNSLTFETWRWIKCGYARYISTIILIITLYNCREKNNIQ